MHTDIKLTEYSHGAGCGCKISPQVLDKILHSELNFAADPNLLVGNQSRDDAAAYDIGNDQVILSTTDFFMPIVDDPFDFGRIAATNAISDIYAMGGKPLMAIAILGWPVNKLAPELAAKVIEGARTVCADAGMMLAGGHSIDSLEPIFGLAVTGMVGKAQLKQNNTATPGCQLLLTKPLGIGILTTAQKQKILLDEDQYIARDLMCQLNKIGADLADVNGVKAMTDVTGFGLLGHLLEICEGSDLNAQLDFDAIPLIPQAKAYLAKGAIPGGTTRNFASYGHKVGPMSEVQQQLLCDPQTSGGLLLAVEPAAILQVQDLLMSNGLQLEPIGHLLQRQAGPFVQVNRVAIDD
jgi:selenide, water dikinase